MTELQKKLYAELYRKSLYDFVKDFWSTVEPSKFIDGKIIKYYCEVFHYFCRKWIGYNEVDIVLPDKKDDELIVDIRQGKQNLCLNVPPRHTKSMIFNVFGPVWLWLSDPIKAVSISHTGSLATEMNTKRHMLINSDKFKFLFPGIFLISNTSSFLKDTRGGELRSLNKNAFTGYGADVIVNDDLTNAETARKDMTEMENTWSYYKNTMPSRINDINKCIIMNIQQRLAPNDVTGHILEDENLAKNYSFVVIPAYFEKTTHFVCPISGEILTWHKGEYLWPERFGDYSFLKSQVGEAVFETQYMQKPVATDKTAIKEDMIICKDAYNCPAIEDADIIYASHDFPVKDKDSSDFLGSLLAYKVGSTLYIKDCLEKKMAFVKSVEYVKQLDTLFPGIIQVIEDKANGSPILQQLQDEVAGLQAYQPGTNSKYTRLETASLYLTSGNVIFLKTKYDEMTQTYSLTNNLQNLINRLLAFPFVEHDDVVDAFSQLILFAFMDRRYMVYGRAFNDTNLINKKDYNLSYTTIFFNKEGDIWKVNEIGMLYGAISKMIVLREERFKASVDEGIKKLKEFAPDKKVFIDTSASESLYGIDSANINIEKYSEEDFDKSVSQLNLAFSKKLILVDRQCKLFLNDLESFKYNKSKDNLMTFITTKDGFLSNVRIALKYFGGIV